MISIRTNACNVGRMGIVPVLPVPELAVDVEHCIWAASVGLQPIDVIAALGMHWPGLALPTWADALVAVRVAAARIDAGEPRGDYPAARHPELRVVAGIQYRRAA